MHQVWINLKQKKKGKGLFEQTNSSFTGVSSSLGDDSKHFTTMVYGNGPGYQIVNGTRPDVNESTACKCMSSREDQAIWQLHLVA